MEVAASLEQRDGYEPGFGQLLWLRHVLDAEAASRNCNRFYCSFDKLLSGWPLLISRAQESINITLPRFCEQTAYKIDEFLTSQMQHHRVSIDTVVDNPLLSVWLRDTFEILHRWSESTENSADYHRLDQIRAEFNHAGPAFSWLVTASQRTLVKLRAIEQQLSESHEKLTTTETVASELRQRTMQLESEYESERQQAAEKIRGLEQQLAETEKKLDIAKADHETRHRQAVLKEQRLAEHAAANTQRISLLEQDLLNVRGKLSHLETRLAERFEEIATLTRLLRDAEAATRRQEEHTNWMRQVATFLYRESWRYRLINLLPVKIRRKLIAKSLKFRGIFDAQAYLQANPDVAKAGVDPLSHYIHHGMQEGRHIEVSNRK
jgi:hypothetical protein